MPRSPMDGAMSTPSPPPSPDGDHRSPAGDRPIRFGLCCLFIREPVTFRTTTAARLLTLSLPERLPFLSSLCLHNARSLVNAILSCDRLGIGAFRVMSPLFPRMTHPLAGYRLDDLPDATAITGLLAAARDEARSRGIRLSLHPDQFVVLSSPRSDVVASSLRELEYHGWLASLIGAGTINVHAGGTYGDRGESLRRLAVRIRELPDPVRSRLSLENDDTSHRPSDLLPLCTTLRIPLVYDVHHHRCNPDGLSVEEVTNEAARTWIPRGEEPYAHISSPRNGWGGGNPRPHADFVRWDDFPECWLDRHMTIDVEAKCKEEAVLSLMADYLDRLKSS